MCLIRLGFASTLKCSCVWSSFKVELHSSVFVNVNVFYHFFLLLFFFFFVSSSCRCCHENEENGEDYTRRGSSVHQDIPTECWGQPRGQKFQEAEGRWWKHRARRNWRCVRSTQKDGNFRIKHWILNIVMIKFDSKHIPVKVISDYTFVLPNLACQTIAEQSKTI